MRMVISRWMVAAVLLLATASMSKASTLGLDVTSDTLVVPGGDMVNLGWQFSVNGPITVDGLGIFDVKPSGLDSFHYVGLWDDAGNLLAQTIVGNGATPVSSASGAGNWLFGDIAPIVLQPGIYVTGAFYMKNADAVMSTATITTAPQITYLASRASLGQYPAEPDAFGFNQAGVFGPNIRIQTPPPAVPEPASLMLLGSGLVTLTMRRRRAQR